MADRDTLESLGRLVDIMARLRAPGGCPWDREQTHESLRPYLVEEAYEVLEAIDRGDVAALRDELGDVLLQVLFHAEIAAEDGRFRLADVASAIADKLERRHPHVFGDVQVRDADEVVRNWRRIKAEERRAAGADPGVLASVPPGQPALARAQQAGSIRGVVYDKEFDTPLPAAQVQIIETGQKAVTADQGNYVFGQVAPGRYTLVFSREASVRQ